MSLAKSGNNGRNRPGRFIFIRTCVWPRKFFLRLSAFLGLFDACDFIVNTLTHTPTSSCGSQSIILNDRDRSISVPPRAGRLLLNPTDPANVSSLFFFHRAHSLSSSRPGTTPTRPHEPAVSLQCLFFFLLYYLLISPPPPHPLLHRPRIIYRIFMCVSICARAYIVADRMPRV